MKKNVIGGYAKSVGAFRGESEAKRAFAPRSRATSIVLSPAEAEEYCVFKRQKRVDEVLAALKKTVVCLSEDLSAETLKKRTEEAKLANSLAVRVPPNKVAIARALLGGAETVVDCRVGGDGETTAKVKKYEAKKAVRDGAARITLVLSPSAVAAGKWGEVKKDVKKVCRAVKKRHVTVALPYEFSKTVALETWKKLAATAEDSGAKYLSVPFCERTSEIFREIKDGVMKEAAGVTSAADFKTFVFSGAESVALASVAKIREELLDEAENESFAVPAAEASFFTPQSDAFKESAQKKDAETLSVAVKEEKT